MILSHWQRGLFTGGIRGFATAMESGIALVAVAPEKFTVSGGVWKTLGAVLLLAVLRAVQVSMAYVRQNPLPEAENVVPLTPASSNENPLSEVA